MAKSNTVVQEVKAEQTKVCLDKALEAENEWVQKKKEEIKKGDAIARAAYHASQKTPTHGLPALCAMLPLFYEKFATPAMIKHGMDVVKQATNLLNPGQIPVVTFDQPLFALAKLANDSMWPCWEACTQRWLFATYLEMYWKALGGHQLYQKLKYLLPGLHNRC